MGPAPLVLAAAALTGITTLAAEVLWMRGLGRGVGMTPEALAGVAGFVLAGLGLGAAYGARAAQACERPARRGGWYLLGAGTWVALSPLYLRIVPDLHARLLDLLDLDGGGGPGPLLLVAAPLILPPAALLGATFPHLVRMRVLDARRTASRTGWIYGFQTAGALLGAVLALFLLWRVGETMALRIVGGGALGAALLLLLGDRRLPHGCGPPAGAEAGRSLHAGPVGPVLCASGAAALVAQLAWVRLLQPLVGPQLWGFALLMGPVLLGVALGAVVVSRSADRGRRAGRQLGVVLVLAGALTVLSLPLAGGLPERLVGGAARAPAHRLLDLAWGVFLACGPAMLAFGAALPLAVRVHADQTGSCAGAAGHIYAWNTLGALAGSLLAAFLLLPGLGSERTLVVAGALSIGAAALLRLRPAGRVRSVPAALHLLPLAVLLWPGLLGDLLRSGPTLVEMIAARKPTPPGLVLRDRDDLRLYATWFAGQPARAAYETSAAVLPVFDGRAGRVELVEEPDGLVGLRRGALREAVFDPDDPSRPAATETALGLIPGLLHRAPDRAVVIGHGAGWTAEALLAVGVEQLDVAEVDAAVLEAARRYRGLEQLPVERSPRARLVETDGRLLLRRAALRPRDERYALVVSQPSHPWSTAAAHLFTQEAYETARAALREDGVMAQWLNLFDLSPRLLRAALGAFRAVFDVVWVFRFPGELVLAGSMRPLVVSAEHRWEPLLTGTGACARLAAAAGFRNPGELWKHFALDTAGLDRVLGTDAGSLHDDDPRLEFEVAWRRLAGGRREGGERILLAGFPPDMASALPDPARRERWLAQAVRGWLRDGRPGEARQWSQRIRWGASADGLAARAQAALEDGAVDRAQVLLARSVAAAPERGDLAAQRLEALVLQLPERAEVGATLQRVDELVARFPDDGRVLAAAGRAHRAAGDAVRARALLERALAASKPEAPAGTGILLARLVLSESREADDLRLAADLLARDPATYERVDALDMAVRLASQGGNEEGAQPLEAALRTLEGVRGLAHLRAAAGHLARHEFDAAVREAGACTTIWASHPTSWELQGLVLLAADAAARPVSPGATAAPGEAAAAFAEAVVRSADPAAARERARRMLGWYGHLPGDLDAALANRVP